MGPVFLCKCKDTFTTFLSCVTFSLAPVIVTDGHASSDWSPGPMLMCVHLGDICIVIGSSLMFLVFFVYVLIRKVVHICFITTSFMLVAPLFSYPGSMLRSRLAAQSI